MSNEERALSINSPLHLLQIPGGAKNNAGKSEIDPGIHLCESLIIEIQVTISGLQGQVRFDFVSKKTDYLIFELGAGPPATDIARYGDSSLR